MTVNEIDRITRSLKALNLEGLTVAQMPDKLHVRLSTGLLIGSELEKIQQVIKGYCLLIEIQRGGLFFTIWGDGQPAEMVAPKNPQNPVFATWSAPFTPAWRSFFKPAQVGK